ncbi:MAG: adenylyl-sulfate kinase [Rhodospirillaceae bacterium]|nr:adenylyl-sulfate kinase [Rhodospirillales bacterium]
MKRAHVFWFTGLSGAGKTTVAEGVAALLSERGVTVAILDGDDVRARFHTHLGFSEADIKENNRLIGLLCQEQRGDADVILVPVIAPYRSARQSARDTLSPDFHEVHFSASVDTVAARDVKGMYRAARDGKITNLIGFSPSAPYEPPEHADFTIDSGSEPVSDSVGRLFRHVLGVLGQPC